jgi:uncharacterized lipoprotein
MLKNILFALGAFLLLGLIAACGDSKQMGPNLKPSENIGAKELAAPPAPGGTTPKGKVGGTPAAQ